MVCDSLPSVEPGVVNIVLVAAAINFHNVEKDPKLFKPGFFGDAKHVTHCHRASTELRKHYHERVKSINEVCQF